MLDREVAAGTSPSKIFVCGLSQGGALALATVLLYPKTLGGCVVFSGSLPLSKSFAERVPTEARKTPVVWFHGMADGVVLFEAGHAGCAFLQELGVPCEFKAYPTLGHTLVDEELQYFQQWIKDRLSQGTCVPATSLPDKERCLKQPKIFSKFIEKKKEIYDLDDNSLIVPFLFSLAASLRRRAPPSQLVPTPMAAARSRSFVLWLHGLGDSGPANEPIRTFFSAAEFRLTKWAFPSAPDSPVSCNHGAVMPSWFDIHELPISSGSPQHEIGVLKAVENVHAVIDKEVADGIHPENIFVCGFSQGGALTLASVLLYPKTLGGGAVFSGWVPFGSSITERISPKARKTPIMWSHGIADKVVLFEAGQAGPPFLQNAGLSCEFKAYPDLGHSISKEELYSLESWIRNQGFRARRPPLTIAVQRSALWLTPVSAAERSRRSQYAIGGTPIKKLDKLCPVCTKRYWKEQQICGVQVLRKWGEKLHGVENCYNIKDAADDCIIQVR
ncbi:hypothetical protein GUJ93_ZPchr0438g28956 [Zizania palustris]|uniref:Phospholipase/carboxylesterase/thioesterase domain-containing protein n=1 Tax=Zizania palustris TaxID=103762 RepID=A0A8J5USQ9_ZIZPA|nr:hypothetical protein GUJ93_ZPchr0438g28956 [Zizania palustris]